MTEMTTYNSSNTPSKETDLISRFIQEALISFRVYFQDYQKNSYEYSNKTIKRNVYINRNKNLDNEIKYKFMYYYILIFSQSPKNVDDLLNCFDEYLRDETAIEHIIGINIEELKNSKMKAANEKLKKNVEKEYLSSLDFHTISNLFKSCQISRDSFLNIVRSRGIKDDCLACEKFNRCLSMFEKGVIDTDEFIDMIRNDKEIKILLKEEDKILPTLIQQETFYSLAKLYLEKSINHKSFWNILNENGLYDLFTVEFEIICNAPEKMNDEFREILIKYNLDHLFDNTIIDIDPKFIDDYIAGNISIKECIYRLNMFSLDKEEIEALEELQISYEERKIIGEKLKKFQDVLYELDNNKFSELVDKYQREMYNLINKLINKEPLKQQKEPSPLFPMFLLGAGIFTAIATTKQPSLPPHHLKCKK
jgi:hypothetical protein